jgi:hypothetical protein
MLAARFFSGNSGIFALLSTHFTAVMHNSGNAAQAVEEAPNYRPQNPT